MPKSHFDVNNDEGYHIADFDLVYVCDENLSSYDDVAKGTGKFYGSDAEFTFYSGYII